MTYILEKNTHWQEKELNSESVVIPADWTSTALNTYADIISGQSPASDLVADLGLDFHQGNSLFGDKYIKPSTKKIDRTRAPKIAPAHSILFSVRAPVGEVNIACTEMCIGRGLAALTTEHVSEWMYFRLKSMSSVFKKLSTGTTFEGITAKNLGAVTFGCPPLNEQTAIANILSNQEDLVAHYNDLIALHEKRFAYLSDELLSGRLRLQISVQGAIEMMENNEWTDVLLAYDAIAIPSDWSITQLNKVANFESGFSFKGADFTNDVTSYPVIRIRDLENQEVKTFFNGNNLPERSFLVQKGDVLIGMDGDFKIVEWLAAPALLNQRILRIGNCPSIQYMKYALKQVLDKIHETTMATTVKHLSVVELNETEVVYPPIEEQTLIAKVLSEQEALIAEYKKLRDAEKKRFDWLSDALLSGTYRVKMEA